MPNLGPSVCDSCSRRSPEKNDYGQRNKCEAFPQGIPVRYLSGQPHFATDGTDKGLFYKLDPTRKMLLDNWKVVHPRVDVPESVQ